MVLFKSLLYSYILYPQYYDTEKSKNAIKMIDDLIKKINRENGMANYNNRLYKILEYEIWNVNDEEILNDSFNYEQLINNIIDTYVFITHLISNDRMLCEFKMDNDLRINKYNIISYSQFNENKEMFINYLNSTPFNHYFNNHLYNNYNEFKRAMKIEFLGLINVPIIKNRIIENF